MPTYIYKARDATGKLIRGTMDAGSKEELIDKLYKMGCIATQASEAVPGIKIDMAFKKLKRISTDDMILFYVQLSNMINAGISILICLRTFGGQIENKKLREIVGNVSRGIEGGDSFSEALAKYPSIFSKLFINMVRVGEASGKLGTVLSRYAAFIEHQVELKQKIKGALIYPIILLFAGIAVTLFIVTFIIPQFAQIFLKVGIKLPLPTLMLYKIGTSIKHFWYLAVLAIFLGLWAIKFYIKTEKGRFKFDRLKLKLPIIGSLFRKTAISGFSRTLATLVASGVPILQSLDIVREVVGNEVLARVLTDVRKAVEKGEKISESLKVSEEFPADVVQMISVGEETGDLDGMLNKTSDFYDMSLGYTIKKITTVFEPLLLIIMGCMVGFVMASLLLPIFDMIKILRH